MPESYNPTKYWTERGKWYMPVFLNKRNEKIELQERVLMQYLLLKEGEIPKGRVLEVGAGFGRISKLILERFHEKIDEYVLLDLSADQLYNAGVYLEQNLKPEVVESVKMGFIQSDFMDFATSDKFDLVLAVEVLMHVLPADIQKAINALISLSKKHVISIDWYEGGGGRNKKPKKEIAAHNTLYNYPRLYINNPLVENFKRIPIRDEDNNKVSEEEQSIFHIIKKKEKVFG